MKHPKDAFTLPSNHTQDQLLEAVEKAELDAQENFAQAKDRASLLRRQNLEIVNRMLAIDEQMQEIVGRYLGFKEYGLPPKTNITNQE